MQSASDESYIKEFFEVNGSQVNGLLTKWTEDGDKLFQFKIDSGISSLSVMKFNNIFAQGLKNGHSVVIDMTQGFPLNMVFKGSNDDEINSIKMIDLQIE